MAGFVTTRWTLVQQAADLSHPDAAAALEHLCRVYWPAIYVYVRQKGFGPPEAADLTQEFFTRILEKRYFDQARRERGRFAPSCLRAHGTSWRTSGTARRRKNAGEARHSCRWTIGPSRTGISSNRITS